MCSIYGSDTELADTVAEFVVEGLAREERCWYLPADDSSMSLELALQQRGINVTAARDEEH